MLAFLRKHWFELGLGLAIAAAYATSRVASPLAKLLWFNLVALFLHQFEEYRWPGTFPGMLNTAMFASQQPDRYPLNANSAMIINVGVGWTSYLLAALAAERAIWLGIATMLVSLGNLLAHGILFNLRGKRFYNPGMFTALAMFGPLVAAFGQRIVAHAAASASDWLIGLSLGLVLNILGIFGLIDWLKDKHSRYRFPARMLE